MCIHVDTVHVSMHVDEQRRIQICQCVWVCTSERKGPLRIYTANANQGTSIGSLHACYIVLQFFAKHSPQLNPDCNEKMPTGFYLCQSIFYGLRDNHDAPFRHRHSLPSKGCITSSHTLEGYVIGKAHWTVYSCSLGAHSRDDIITKCYSHQILAYHPLSAAPSSSQVELQP